jgi:hypothetical protein
MKNKKVQVQSGGSRLLGSNGAVSSVLPPSDPTLPPSGGSLRSAPVPQPSQPPAINDNEFGAAFDAPFEPVTRYRRAAEHWMKLGFAVVPSQGHGNKQPAPKFGWTCPDPHGSDTTPIRGVLPEDINEWDTGDVEPLLVLDSGRLGVRLIVVDVDDPALLGWVEQQFGPSPLYVETGREGGGRHVYYRAPDGVHLPLTTSLTRLPEPASLLSASGWPRRHRL